MSNSHKKICMTLIYIERFVILVSAVTGCISICSFAYLFGITTEITSYATRLKVCAMTAVIKKYRSVTKKKKMKLHKIVLLAKPRLNSQEFLISKALIN